MDPEAHLGLKRKLLATGIADMASEFPNDFE